MNELGLCAGNGGLSLGLRLAVPATRTVVYLEREAFAVQDLVRKMHSGCLDEAPVWTDLTTFNGKPWSGVVDIITAGFPCQPFSVAGKQLGTDDERWIWPDIERIIEEVEPGMVFLENVPGIVRHGLGPILQGLARLGFDAEWDLFAAQAVGAPHRRTRFFLLAVFPDSVRNDGGEILSQGQHTQSAESLSDGQTRRTLSDPTVEREHWWRSEPGLGRVAHGTPDRVDRLRSIGNGVVPLVVAHAFRTLAARMNKI